MYVAEKVNNKIGAYQVSAVDERRIARLVSDFPHLVVAARGMVIYRGVRTHSMQTGVWLPFYDTPYRDRWWQPSLELISIVEYSSVTHHCILPDSARTNCAVHFIDLFCKHQSNRCHSSVGPSSIIQRSVLDKEA